MIAPEFVGTTVSLEIEVFVGLLLCAAAMGAVLDHGRLSITRRFKASRERRRSAKTLTGLFRAREVAREVDDLQKDGSLARADAQPGTDTMLRAKLDHMREVQQLWGSDTRRNALDQVAGIMRRSVRRSDPQHSDIVNEVEGDGFTMLVRGAQEKDAANIAKRLRRELARSQIEGIAHNIRLTASFGVASRKPGESYAQWRARAQAALQKAEALGEDQIVEASVVEEPKLLPPPSPEAQTKAA